MPLIHGYSNATRSKNIATLRREGLPEKRAVAAAYRIQRQARRRRNPTGGIHWGALATGAAVGAVAGGVVMGAVGLSSGKPIIAVGGALDGALAGWGVGGLVGGVKYKSWSTAGVGVAGTVVGFYTLLYFALRGLQ